MAGCVANMDRHANVTLDKVPPRNPSHVNRGCALTLALASVMSVSRPDTIATRRTTWTPAGLEKRPQSKTSLDTPPDTPMSIISPSPTRELSIGMSPTLPLPLSLRKPDAIDMATDSELSHSDSPTLPLNAVVNRIASFSSDYTSGFSDDDFISVSDSRLSTLVTHGLDAEDEPVGVVPNHSHIQHGVEVDINTEIMKLVSDPALKAAMEKNLRDMPLNETYQLQEKLVAAKERHDRELKTTLERVEREVREAFQKELTRQQGIVWNMFKHPKTSIERVQTPQPPTRHLALPSPLSPGTLASRRSEVPKEGGTPELWRALQASPINRQVLALHLVRGGSPNLLNADGYSLLYFALINNSYEAFSLLIDRGVNIESSLVHGHDVCAMHLVAQFDYTQTLKVLLEHRATLDSRDVHGQTPLFFAVRHESLGAMRMLLQAGATVNLVDAYDYSVLYYAVSSKNEESVEMLLKHRAIPDYHPEITPLFNALFYNYNLSIAHLLVKHGANLSWTDKSDNHNSLLHKAILRKAHSAAHFLIDTGCDVNSQNNQRNTPLYLALRERNMDIARALLETGDRLNRTLRNENGATPLHVTVTINSMEALKMLVTDFPSTPSNVNVLDASGGTPLFYAVKGSTIYMVEHLLANGADPTISNTQSPFLYAIKHGFLDKVKAMLKHSNGGSSYRFGVEQLREALREARFLGNPRQEVIHALEQAVHNAEQQPTGLERVPSQYGSPPAPFPFPSSPVDRVMSQYGTPPGGGFAPSR
ncbi:ankyrin repeat-containing domain protein [Jimgerdemannia flammicorona]|uniref:Ankyrin repeat-containing domain protein n=1 Tax=Jimgerdemannia flammicorona TaxID=994334 RepID=A0A433CX21_9FUNG|nr:ankyrin repeat-containing domain protein [Jimgerdemannia flammicorona]